MSRESRSQRYLNAIGVRDLQPRTVPFDPGYDPASVTSHLEQSGHLMAMLKLSMACWQVADERATRRKIEAAHRNSVRVCSGGGPFEVAVARGRLPEFLDLCADLGFDQIEAGQGFTDMPLGPAEVIRMARERGLCVHFEVGNKHDGSFTGDMIAGLIEQARSWLDAGADQIVVEARESAEEVGLFGAEGELDTAMADRFAGAFGLEKIIFEAPNKPSQFAFLRHFGPEVFLTNVRIEELLRVEIFRRGLHPDAFGCENLTPRYKSATCSDA